MNFLKTWYFAIIFLLLNASVNFQIAYFLKNKPFFFCNIPCIGNCYKPLDQNLAFYFFSRKISRAKLLGHVIFTTMWGPGTYVHCKSMSISQNVYVLTRWLVNSKKSSPSHWWQNKQAINIDQSHFVRLDQFFVDSGSLSFSSFVIT